MRLQLLSSLRRRLLPRTLFGRSLLILATPIFLLQLIVAFIFFDRHWDSMSTKLVFALAGEIDMLSERLAAAKTQEQTNAIVKQAAKSLELLITVEDAKASVYPDKRLHFEKYYWFSIGPKLRRTLDQRLNMPFMVRPYENERWFEVVVQISNKKVARFLSHDRRLTSATTYIFVLWLIGSAFILFAISLVFMRNQIRPIMRLAIAAERLGKGQDVPDFRPVGATEVRQASQAFLNMKERLKRQIEQRTAMLAGVSHDLRTPLTRMKLQVAMSKNTAEADNLRQDIEEMERMIEGYLTFAKGEGNEASEMTDMKPLVERIIANAKRQGYDVQEQISGSLMIRVRPLAIERAIANIVNNACKYAKHVWVTVHEQSGVIEISVDDDGPGIAKELREEVFRPFYRVEKSRNKKTGGIGLGLSITQDIVHAHGGEVFLEESNRGGLRVVVRLPL